MNKTIYKKLSRMEPFDKTLADKYFSISFVLIVLVSGLLSVGGLKRMSVSLADLASGEIAKAIEAEYDERFVMKELGTNAWAAIEYRLFKEGKQGVIVGKEGWLFSSEEFQDQPDHDHTLAQNFAYISWVNQQLLAQNIRLLVVPVPAKARVYSDNVGKKQPSANQQSTYERFIGTLNSEGVAVSDSLLAMEQHKEHAEDSLFLRTDTHWSAEGANLVARQVASVLQTKFSDITLSSKAFFTEKVGEKSHQGDLINFLPLTPWFDQLLPEMDQINLYRTYSVSSEDDLFADNTINVALVGTSYSASPDWNFEGSLKHSLSADLANFSEQGHGPMVPMASFLEQHLASLPKLSVVIWEIPERYLQVSYSQAYASMNSADEFIAGTDIADIDIPYTRIVSIGPQTTNAGLIANAGSINHSINQGKESSYGTSK